MPLVLQMTWFQHYFPNSYRRDDYPTSDHIIPYKLFYLMIAASAAHTAFERINTGLGVMLGKNILENPNRSQVQQLLQTYHNESRGIFK